MAVESLRRGRGFHKRRHRPNVARAELAKAAREVVRETVEPPLVRRQGKGKGGDGKGDGKGKGSDGAGKGKAAPSAPPAPPAPPAAAEPLPTAAAPSNSIVLNAGNPAETIVPPLNPPSTVAPPPPGAPAPPPPPPGAPGATSSSTSASSSLTTSTAVTSVQTTQTSIQTQTTVITTAQTSTEVSTQVTTITSLSTDVSTSTPFVASTPYQAAPSSTTTSAAASRAPAIAPGTIAGIVVGILSFFFIILGAVCLCSRRTRQRLLTPVTRRFTNNTLVNSGSRGVDSTGRRSGRGGDMHKSLMSEAESMAYTTTASPRDVKAPPQMAMVEPSHGLSQNPVFMGAAYPSRPNSWRTWRPSATFAQGLDPVPDDMQLPPPPPHALTGNRYPAFPPQARGSGVSTGGDSSMPEYGSWPPAASNADLTALAPAPGQAVTLAPGYVAAAVGPERVQSRDYFRQQAEAAIGSGGAGEGEGDGHASYVTYSETPLATPRTPIVVEGEQLAPLATSQEASPVDNCDCDSGEGGDAGRGTRSDDNVWDGEQQQQHRGLDSSASNITITGGDGRVSRGRGIGGGGGSSGGDDEQPEGGGGIQEAQLGREAGEGGGHGGGAQGVEAEPPGEQGGQQAEQGQQGEPGERGQQVLEEVAAIQGIQGQRGLRGRSRTSHGSRRSASFPLPPRAPSYWDEDSGSSDDRFSWSEAASEPYTAVAAPAPTDGFGLSIIGAGRGSRSARAGVPARPGGDG